MIPFNFEYYRPNNIKETIALSDRLKSKGKKVMYYGGGTEFISMSRLNNIYADGIIDIKDIPQCSQYEIDGDELIIGAGVTLTQIAELNLFPLLSLAVKRIADHTIQDKVTIGGNLMGSIIYREASLPLLVANSDVVIGNKEGIGRKSFNDYWNTDVKSKEGDLIIQFIIKTKYLNMPYFHVKRTKNEKIDYPLISLVGLKENNNINIAFSGLCDVSFRSFDIEKILNDKSSSNDKKISNIIRNIPYEVLDDISGSSEYRKFILGKMLEQVIKNFEEV